MGPIRAAGCASEGSQLEPLIVSPILLAAPSAPTLTNGRPLFSTASADSTSSVVYSLRYPIPREANQKAVPIVYSVYNCKVLSKIVISATRRYHNMSLIIAVLFTSEFRILI